MRRELERRGIVMRFCDECYWGELEKEERPDASAPPAREEQEA